MPERTKTILDWAMVLMAGGFSLLCGWLAYLLKVMEGKQFLVREFLLHGAISAISGGITFTLLNFQGLPPDACGALSGVAGWGGTRAIKLAELIIMKRLGVTKEELNK